MDKFSQLRETVIHWIDSLHEALCECPFQYAATTLVLSLWMVMSQSCTEFSQSQMTTSSTAMHSAHPISHPFHFQPGRSIQAAHALPTRRPIPQDVEVLIQMLRLTDVRGVSNCETFWCDRTMCHHKRCWRDPCKEAML